MLQGLSGQISDSDPGTHNRGLPVRKVRPFTKNVGARRAANLVNEFVGKSYSILKNHPLNLQRQREGKLPANITITRGAGTQGQYRDLPAELGLRVACISGDCTVLGIARLSGVEAISTSEMTGNLDTNLAEKLEKVIEALHDSDLVCLHLKGCGVAGHYR